MGMCGSTSAVGLEERERELWVEVKEQLREPGQLNGLMRGVLGNEEVAVVVAIEPVGLVRPLAVLVTPAIGEELVLPELTPAGPGPVAAYAGEYPVRVWLGKHHHRGAAVAVEVTPWMREHLLLYARRLWYPPRDRRG